MNAKHGLIQIVQLVVSNRRSEELFARKDQQLQVGEVLVSQIPGSEIRQTR